MPRPCRNAPDRRDRYLLPVLAGHRDEAICPRIINCPRETSVELDPSEADAQEQLFQLIARIEPMPQADCAHAPSSDSVVTVLCHAMPYPSYARFSSSMSIFFIRSIDFMTLWDFLESGLVSISSKTLGITCHEAPY